MPEMNIPPTYPSGAASLFHAAAASKREESDGKTVIWAYCPTCWTQTDQMFVGDAGKFEKYICLTCQVIREIAVR